MKSFSILNNTVLVVELDKPAKRVFISEGTDRDTFETYPEIGISYDLGTAYKRLPEGNWQLLGNLTSIKEEEVKPLIDKFRWNQDGYHTYKDYTVHAVTDPAMGFPFDRALESLESAIIAAGWYLDKNPYGEEQRSYSELMDGVNVDELQEDMRLWLEAQSRVLNRERTYIFKIKE